jgi:hypothetical protein
MAHTISEAITEQPSILIGGELKEYQLKGWERFAALKINLGHGDSHPAGSIAFLILNVLQGEGVSTGGGDLAMHLSSRLRKDERLCQKIVNFGLWKIAAIMPRKLYLCK